jgi:hypothetical protein
MSFDLKKYPFDKMVAKKLSPVPGNDLFPFVPMEFLICRGLFSRVGNGKGADLTANPFILVAHPCPFVLFPILS